MTAAEYKRGFTMIELLITLGIFFMLAAVGIPLMRNVFTNAQLSDAEDTLVQNLRTAQVRAQSGVNGSSHGVFIEAHQYTLFQGESYALRNVVYDRVVPVGDGIDLVATSPGSVFQFAQGTGIPSVTGTVQMSQNPTGSSTIFINELGSIELSS